MKKKLEDVFYNIKRGNQFIIKKDSDNKVYGAEMRYDGDIPIDMVLVDIDKFVRTIPNIIKQLDQNNIYRLTYNMFSKEYINTIEDKNNDIISSTASNDLNLCIFMMEDTYTNKIGRVFNKIKRKIRKVS